MVGGNYKALEARLLAAIHRRAGLPETVPVTTERIIKRADQAAAWFEATQLAGFSETEAMKHFKRPRFRRAIDITLDPLPPLAARDGFLDRYARLRHACGYE